MLIYRAIPRKYENEPLRPSLLYKENLAFLENNINRLLDNDSLIKGRKFHNISEIKTLLNFSGLSDFNPLYKNLNENDVYYHLLLSILNIALACNRNRDYEYFSDGYPIGLKCFTPNDNYYKNNGFCTLNLSLVIEDIIDFLKEFPGIKMDPHGSRYNTKYLRISRLWYTFAIFQHINLIYDAQWFNHRNQTPKNLYPIMSIDWTTSKTVIKQWNFGGLDKIVIQIDLNKYISKFKIPYLPPTAYKDNSSVFGLSGYKNFLSKNNSDFRGNERNNLMKQQHGLLIFWPWLYTISDLEKNDLGRFLDFKIIM